MAEKIRADETHSLTLNWNDKLGDDGEYLGLAVLKQVHDALHREEPVGVLLLADALHEDGQVVMVVELGDFDFPRDLIGRAMLDLDGQIAAIIEATELTRRDLPSFHGASLWGQNGWPLFGLVQ